MNEKRRLVQWSPNGVGGDDRPRFPRTDLRSGVALEILISRRQPPVSFTVCGITAQQHNHRAAGKSRRKSAWPACRSETTPNASSNRACRRPWTILVAWPARLTSPAQITVCRAGIIPVNGACCPSVGRPNTMQKIAPHLWFDKEAREAVEFYVSIFPGSRVANVTKLSGTPSGDCDVVSFDLAGQPFMAIGAGPLFKFNPSVMAGDIYRRDPAEVHAHAPVRGSGVRQAFPGRTNS